VCIGNGVLFRGRSHSTRGLTDNYPNDSFHPSLYPHSRIMQKSRDKNGFRPRSHAEAKKRSAYADWPHINGNNRFTELYKHAKFTSALESFGNWHFRFFFGFTYVQKPVFVFCAHLEILCLYDSCYSSLIPKKLKIQKIMWLIITLLFTVKIRLFIRDVFLILQPN